MLTGLPQLRTPEAFGPWLNQITGHICGKRISQNIRHRRVMKWYHAYTARSWDHLNDQLIPDKILDTEETRRMIVELVDALPPIQRLCVLLYYYDEMSIKDIAAALEVPEGTIKSRLYYARRSIKKSAERAAAQGTPLYGLSPLPFLQYFLQQEVPDNGLRTAALRPLVQAVLAGAASAAGTAAAATAFGALAGRGALILAGLLLTAVTAGTLLPYISAPKPVSEPEPAIQQTFQEPRQESPISASQIPVNYPGGEPLLPPEPEPVSQPAESPNPQPAALTFTPTPPPQEPEPEPELPPEPVLPPEQFVPFIPPEPDPAPVPTFEPEPAPEPEPPRPVSQPVQPSPDFRPEFIPSLIPPKTEPEPDPVPEPEPITYAYTFNSDFSGTFLGVNDEGIYEFETTIHSNQEFEQCPLFTTGCWGPLELSNPTRLGEAGYAFCGKAPGTCDVIYYIGETPEGPFDRKAAVVHVTIVPPEPLTYNSECGKLVTIREDGVYILEMQLSEKQKNEPQPQPFLSGSHFIRFESSDPEAVKAEIGYFCAAGPGTAEVQCYIRYTEDDPDELKAIVHVTVTPVEEEKPLPPSPTDTKLGLPYAGFTVSSCISGGYLGPNEDGVFIFESTILADGQFHMGPLLMRGASYYLESSDMEVADFENDNYRGLTPGTADIYYYTAYTKEGPYNLRAILHVTVRALYG